MQQDTRLQLTMSKPPSVNAQGETVPYIICVEKEEDEDGLKATADRPSKAIADRAFHPDELAANPKLMPDLEYYLAQQVICSYSFIL